MAELNENGNIVIHNYEAGENLEVETQVFFELFDEGIVDDDADWIAGYQAWRAFEIGRDYGS